MEEITAKFTIEQNEPLKATFKAYDEPPSIGGTTDYTWLENKPQINDVTLVGNKTLGELGIQPVGDYATQTDIMQAIASIPQFGLSIVDELPLAGEKMTLYLVPKEGANNDVYDEYIWVEQTSSFEFLGTTAVDLTDYLPLSGGTLTDTLNISKIGGSTTLLNLSHKSTDTSNANTWGFYLGTSMLNMSYNGNGYYTFAPSHYSPAGNGVRDLGQSYAKWKTLYATKINNGADIEVPTAGGTMALKSNVIALSDSTVELATNTIYNAGEMATLAITFPTADETYVSQLNFTSGATATAFTAPDTVKWIGDDISDGAFVPATGKRYSIMFYYDGIQLRGAIQGVA